MENHSLLSLGSSSRHLQDNASGLKGAYTWQRNRPALKYVTLSCKSRGCIYVFLDVPGHHQGRLESMVHRVRAYLLFFYFSTCHQWWDILPLFSYPCLNPLLSRIWKIWLLPLFFTYSLDVDGIWPCFFFVRINLCVSLLPISTGLQRQVHEFLKFFSSGGYAATKIFIIYAI